MWLVPETLSYEQAASVSMCALTAAQGVFFRLGFPSPFFTPTSPTPIGGDVLTAFVYGASTSLGLYAAQWLNLAAATSGKRLRLIGAASASRHAMLREAPYSYAALVDYRDAAWAEKVRELAGNGGVDAAVDCISEGKTVYGTCDVLKDSGKYAVFRAPAGGAYNLDELRIKPIYGAVWEGLGVEIEYYSESPVFAPNYFQFGDSHLPC